MRRFKLLMFLFLLLPVASYAGGYRVALQSARLLGMGHAGTALFGMADNAFFNPSGIAFSGAHDQFALGLNLVISKVKYQNAARLWTAQTHNPVGTPFYLYYTHPISGGFYLGLALYTPFGSTVKWDHDWVGSHLVNDISLEAFFFQPSLIYKVSDYISLGVSFIAARGSIVYNKNINRFMQDGDGNRTDITLDAHNASGAGYGFSLSIRPSDKVSIGFNYRSKVWLRSRYGKATINDNPGFLPGKDNFSAALPMPAEMSIGLACRPTEKLTVALDMNQTFWSVYKELKIDFVHLPDNRMPKNWQDTFTYRIGVQYAVTGNLQVRAGYYYDQSPIPATYFSPETPSLDTRNFTAGFTYRMGKWAFHASLLYVKGLERADSYDYYLEGMSAPRFEGSYVENAFVPAFGMDYQF